MIDNSRSDTILEAGACLLAGASQLPLVRRIAAEAGLPLGRVTVDSFADGEVHVEIHDRVAGADVFVVQSMHGERPILELLLLIDAAVRAGARRTVAVIPYFGYARQDRRHGQEPLSAALMIRLIEAAGASAVIVLDLHNQALEGCFRIPCIPLLPGSTFITAWQQNGLDSTRLVIAAADAGALKRVSDLSLALGAAEPPIVLHKRRSPNGCEVLGLCGAVAGRQVMLVDDIVASGDTLLKGAMLLKDHGAAAVYASVTHSVCPENLPRLLAGPLDRLFISDSLPVDSVADERLVIVSVAGLLAEAVQHLVEISCHHPSQGA